MTRGKRIATAVGASLLLVAWSIAQLVLTHRQTDAAERDYLNWYHRALAAPGVHHVVPPHPAPTRSWLVPAFSSIVAAMALAIVAALLVHGGRRWWAAVVVVAPAANAWRGWEDGQLLGWGWMQISDHYVAWQVAGIAVDTLVVAAVALTLAAAVPVRKTGERPQATALRAVPPMLVLAGWWFARNPLADQVSHRIWLVQALAYALAVALLATAQLSVAARAAAILAVLPFCSVATSWAAIDDYGIVAKLVHHDLFALATATYVLGVPALVRALRSGRPTPAVVVASGG